ncbi:TadE family protein [Oceanimonas baumannii]|uniref:TadE-like protein n=2 Tax=Oceanimonas baumannii TaxID=129578 RepID=A0ABY2F207_9GAMM|nr:TadE/TadG family type IV pilus assembly protein [Oceanimonas baumannii]TDW61414.1 TadE-like protein [Oceanimonas baumannii]
MKNRYLSHIPCHRKVKGAASIEMAIVFMLIFSLFYGIISYAIPLILGAAYQQLSAEVLRKSVSTSDIYLYRADTADDKIDNILIEAETLSQKIIADSWLPEKWTYRCEGYGDNVLSVSADGSEWKACVRHAKPTAIMPVISLLGFEIPQLPDEIKGEASLRIR